MMTDIDKNVVLYGYDPQTLLYAGSFDYYWAHGTGLAANSTLSVPPTDAQPGHVIKYDKDQDAWNCVPNYFGRIAYSIDTKQPYTIDYYGDVVQGYTLQKPASLIDVWDGNNWVDMRSPEQVRLDNLASMPVLNRKQFKLAMLSSGKLLDMETGLANIPEPLVKLRFEIEYQESSQFTRDSDFILYVQQMLMLDDTQMNNIWELGTKI